MPVSGKRPFSPTVPARSDSQQTALFLGLACFALGQGVQVSNGNLHLESIRWLTIALLLHQPPPKELAFLAAIVL